MVSGCSIIHLLEVGEGILGVVDLILYEDDIRHEMEHEYMEQLMVEEEVKRKDIYAAGYEKPPLCLTKRTMFHGHSFLRMLRADQMEVNLQLIMIWALCQRMILNQQKLTDGSSDQAIQDILPVSEDLLLLLIVVNCSGSMIAQPGMNMGQDRQMQMVGANGGNQFRQYAGQNIGYQNGNIGMEMLVAARAEGNAPGEYCSLDEIEEVNANCILMANLQQAPKSGIDEMLVSDSEDQAEYDSNVISDASSVEQEGGTVEQHPVTVEETLTSNSVPSSRESTVVNNERVIAPGIFRIHPLSQWFDELSNGENQVVSKSSAVTTADASDKCQQQQDSTSSTSTLATAITADGNFDL
ncbi:hypothetical protein Tco_0837458 [Tanacetum coccineum]